MCLNVMFLEEALLPRFKEGKISINFAFQEIRSRSTIMAADVPANVLDMDAILNTDSGPTSSDFLLSRKPQV